MTALLEAPVTRPDDPVAPQALFDELYAELHRLARRELHRYGSLPRLGTTTVLHEAYLTMSSRGSAVFADRARFMGYAARVMRGLIVDDLRRQRSLKRGGLFHITTLRTQHADNLPDADAPSLDRINDALDELAAVEPELAEIIELKFFCGFSFGEIAAMRGISERTVQRAWERGRLYLHHALSEDGPAAALVG